MRNLAGQKDSDIWCAAELTAARILIDRVERPYGEPQTRVIGTLGGIEFRRAWYYWVARGRVPLDVAQRLYEDPVGRKEVRVAGHCGCPPPEEWADWFDGDDVVVLDPNGEQERDYDMLIRKGALTTEDKPRFAKSTDGLQGYITIYHIDSEAGLRLFADAVRGLGG